MLSVLSCIITTLYYMLIAYAAVLLIYNLIKSRKWDKELLYIVVLIPFLLRLFRLK